MIIQACVCRRGLIGNFELVKSTSIFKMKFENNATLEQEHQRILWIYSHRQAVFCQLIFIYVITNPEPDDVMVAGMIVSWHLSKVFKALLSQVS
jgi:hypothetical protein